jgi:hypothetical protein
MKLLWRLIGKVHNEMEREIKVETFDKAGGKKKRDGVTMEIADSAHCGLVDQCQVPT